MSTVLALQLLIAHATLAIENPVSFEQLVDELDHPDSERCWNAIDALGARGDSRAVPPLMIALRKDMEQRKGFAMAIIPALGQLKDERAVPLLIEALNKRDENWLGRESAARALGNIGSTKAIPTLIKAAWLADTRDEAIGALAAIGYPGAIDVLLSALSESEEPEVQEAAIAGLVRIGEPAIPALINMLELQHKEFPANHERARVAQVLGEIGHRNAVAPLTSILDDPSGEVRESARMALDLLTH